MINYTLIKTIFILCFVTLTYIILDKGAKKPAKKKDEKLNGLKDDFGRSNEKDWRMP